MASTNNGKGGDEVEEGLGSGVRTIPVGSKVKGLVPLDVSTSSKELLGPEKARKLSLGQLSSLTSRAGFAKYGPGFPSLASPSTKFRLIAEEKDDVSRSVPSTASRSLRERLRLTFGRKINWDSLWKMFKEWIRNPMNMALFLWIIIVAVSGAILFLVMTGMLNHVLPRKSQRNAWFEVNNQILNALFTLMCLYQHPKRIHHLILLCRWRPEDILKLRKIYCKDGTYKPHEWAHMLVVVVLLNLNCLAQYVMCGLNVGYKRSERPPIGIAVAISIAIGAAAGGGLYTIVSPLGRDYEPEMDHEAQNQIPLVEVKSPSHLRATSLEKRFSFASRDNQRLMDDKPEWRGGLFDFWDDISLAYLSLFCSFCVFGWNMERLGFGNMYVHIMTFLLFCIAPFFIFNLAAVNIDDEMVREALGVTGIVLCIFGLLYGGFWRIQMRKRFNLPPNKFCCGNPAITDCAQWLFCCSCSLAQEVRTGDFYDIMEDKLCRKKVLDEVDEPVSSPLHQEDGSAPVRSFPSSPLRGSYSPSNGNAVSNVSSSPDTYTRGSRSPAKQLQMVEESSSEGRDNTTMAPPAPSLIKRDDHR